MSQGLEHFRKLKAKSEAVDGSGPPHTPQRPQHGSRARDEDAPTPHELRHRQTRFVWNREGGRKTDKPPTLGIVYKFSIDIRPMPLGVSAGNIPGRIPDAPA